MKKGISSFLVPFAALLLSMIAIGAQAQDDGITSDDLQTSSPEAVAHENKTLKNLVSSRDSLQISDFYQKPKTVDRKIAATESTKEEDDTLSLNFQKPKAVDRKLAATESNEEDDALSLNFLFYIIENYKFSDLMDEY